MRAPLLRPVLALLLTATVVAGCSGSTPGSSSSGLAPAGANHTLHLQSGVYSAGMTCDTCHGPTGFVVDFSQNPMVQAAGATFDPATKTCSNVSCHGNFSFNGVSGSPASAIWSDATPVTCTSCHGMPPTGHPPIAGTPDAKSCAACHSDSVMTTGAINVAAGVHINGLAEVSFGSCSSCHGDPNRVATVPGADLYLSSAPPVMPGGAPASAVGAHLAHLNPNPAALLATPVACAECHFLPADAAHATSPPARKVAFGPLARSGGAAPSYVAGSAGCAASYCHGNFSFNGVTGSNATPVWTSVTAMTCTSCHGMPPTGHLAIAAPVTAASCADCHSDSVNADGTINVATGAHMNGKSEALAGSCTACHGEPTRVGTVPGTDFYLSSAPPIAPPGAPANAEGAHLAHLNPNPATSVAAPVACAECHVVPADLVHATAPPAQRVVFGPLSRTGGAAPTWTPISAGCAASYCHGNFAFGLVKGSNATPVWTDTIPLTCTSCHGMPPLGHMALLDTSAAACSTCHPTAVKPDGTIVAGAAHLNGRPDMAALGCTDCHGDKARKGILAGADLNLPSAPPVTTAAAPAYAIGAHIAHVNPAAASSAAVPVACVECHVVPTDFAHGTNPPAQKVVFGPIAKTGGAAPTWAAGTTGCAASYCHGNFNFNGVTGANVVPLWTDTAKLTCVSCHGMPPTGHVPVALPATAASCASCHPSAVNPDGSINRVAKGHLNGLPDTSALGCASCHGDVNRKGTLPGTDANLVSAPPVASPGAPAYAVGTHLGHVNPTAASFLMAPIACKECHVVPTDSAHAKNPPAQSVVFGALTRTGGAAPVWNAVSAGCSATYCHGNFAFGVVSGAKAAPVWNSTAALTCTSCHGMPPTGHFAVTAPVTASTCAKCHPDTVNTDGTINATAKGHLNGLADTTPLTCTTCHGDAARKGTLVGTDGNLASAPPIAQPGAPSYAVGAHMAHMNPTAASYLMPPIACKECHVVPLDEAHATTPPPSVVVFGTLSKTGGALPTFVAGTAGCAASYCHGNFTLGTVKGANATPLWTGTTKLTCTACHGMPPTGHPTYTGLPTPASCFQCHPQSVNADGTIKVGGGHINGKIDGGGCTGCHGDPPTTGKHTNSNHRNLRCDSCHPTGYTSTVAIDPFHKNNVVDINATAGYSCGLKGCATGAVRTCTNKCHGRETW